METHLETHTGVQTEEIEGAGLQKQVEPVRAQGFDSGSVSGVWIQSKIPEWHEIKKLDSKTGSMECKNKSSIQRLDESTFRIGNLPLCHLSPMATTQLGVAVIK